MKSLKLIVLLALVVAVTGLAQASIITNVVRSSGQVGDRDPIGEYFGDTAPLATEAGGLKDGNLVYSDRTYGWESTPAQLAGAEYVRTFNSDKDGGFVFVTYDVTISVDAILAIAVDDRIPAEWEGCPSQQAAVDLATQAIPYAFIDSGLNVTIAEGTPKPMSVYMAEVPAGTYTFGMMPSGKNFYSIGAIPEPATLALLGLGGLLLRRKRR